MGLLTPFYERHELSTMSWGSTSSYGAYITTSSGAIALRAVNPNKASGYYAGYFDGNVRVNGSLTCSPACAVAMGAGTSAGSKAWFKKRLIKVDSLNSGKPVSGHEITGFYCSDCQDALNHPLG